MFIYTIHNDVRVFVEILSETSLKFLCECSQTSKGAHTCLLRCILTFNSLMYISLDRPFMCS